MGDMDDPLRKFVEQNFDRIFREATEQFPHRRSDIDALLMGAAPKREDGGKRARGVKGSKGRPPINKSVLAGWLLLLVKIIGCAQFKTQIEKGQPPSPALIPSKRWTFNRIAESGLSFTIDEGANPIRYPLTSSSTLKRHYTFASSKAVDCVDAMNGLNGLSRHLSYYLERPPEEEAYYFKQLGDDVDQFIACWEFLISKRHALIPEPWRQDFQVAAAGMEGRASMTLHFPPLKKPTWLSLQTGLEIWGFIEFAKLKNNPPSKEEIAEHRKFRRDKPQPNLEQWRQEFDGS